MLLRRVLASVWADALLAAALLALGQYEVWGGVRYDGGPVFPGPQAANALVVVPFLTLPLVLKRRAPLVSFALVLGTVGWASLAFGGGEATTEFVAVVVSVYSATANAGRRYAVLAGALVVGALHEVRDPHVHGLGDVVFAAGLLAVAWLFGVAFMAATARSVRSKARRPGSRSSGKNGLARRSPSNGRVWRANCTTSWRTRSASSSCKLRQGSGWSDATIRGRAKASRRSKRWPAPLS